jgi:hypothetical protein
MQINMAASNDLVERPSSASAAAFLTELVEGPYLHISLLLDASSLHQVDTTCRSLRATNNTEIGAWRRLGERNFIGLELDDHGIFGEASNDAHSSVDWKKRFHEFTALVPSFCQPFAGPHITEVAVSDEVASLQCQLRTDLLSQHIEDGIYIEAEVLRNADNLSLAVTDFASGGCSSCTFSPDTGAVIRERKLQDNPRKVEGAYIQPLPQITANKFHGIIGLYLRADGLAFFRRCGEANKDGSMTYGEWETTGIVSDLDWAEGTQLRPCIAFRTEGLYSVKILTVTKQTPLPVGRPGAAPKVEWNSFDWESGDNDMQ